MIRRSFIILPKVGVRTEQKLWRNGIRLWDDFRSHDHIAGINAERKVQMDRELDDADRFLHIGRSDYFTALLPTVEHWRLFERFGDDAAYLDIETDGLGSHARVTVVSVHHRGDTKTFVRGQGLSAEKITDSLKGAKMLVTYNGSSFDLPMLQKEFPFAVPRLPHFDLRHGANRVGLAGGLKNLERQFGIERPQEVAFVTGEEAVYLWKLWERKGKENALKLLVRYNIEDTVNLEFLSQKVHAMLVDRAMKQAEDLP